MRSICFYFQVHQPYRLRNYRFFEIGNNHNYFDEYQNRYIMQRVAEKCYLPMNKLLLGLINEFGQRFKVSFSISGVALEQFRKYTPQVIDSFRALADTGCVEFIAETYGHSLAALRSEEEFALQVNRQQQLLSDLIGYKSSTFRNTELIYSDEIGQMVYNMGFDTMLTEGAKHILGWKSPNYMYCNASNPKLKLLLKNFRLSDDIAFRFSQRSWEGWPLTAEKYVDWLNQIDPKEEVVNLFMDYETFGEHQWEETGIFDFMRALPRMVFANSLFGFATPSELSRAMQPVAPVHVPEPISWADEERDLTAWLGNDLQDDAFDTLYSLRDTMNNILEYSKSVSEMLLSASGNNPAAQEELRNLHDDWLKLQTSDHFYYMCTKWFADGDVHKYFNPYGTPYDAYINYMNVLSDFMLRLSRHSFLNSSQSIVQKEVVEPLASKKTVRSVSTAKKKAVPKTASKKKSEALSPEIKQAVRGNHKPAREIAVSAKKKTEVAKKEPTVRKKQKATPKKKALTSKNQFIVPEGKELAEVISTMSLINLKRLWAALKPNEKEAMLELLTRRRRQIVSESEPVVLSLSENKTIRSEYDALLKALWL
ncbi:MAG: alpha-amylase [Bacteroidetes bacterium HGW-Bacteroidetes-6]|jgi:alpha-amylase|nr:MAG: alpha-amylase [Bacteroidetes bacterium HGW-Bacteroidetes-6]